MNRMLVVSLSLVLVSGLLLSGCSTGSTTRPADGATYTLSIDVPGKKAVASLDSAGNLISAVEISSADGKVRLTIDRGTALIDIDGKPLKSLRISAAGSLPPPPDAYVVGPAFTFEPKGAAAEPPMKLTIRYEPDAFPSGAKETDSYIAYNDGSGWLQLPYRLLDSEANAVATRVESFSTFAILAPKPGATTPPPPPVVGAQAGNLAPDFKLPGLDGTMVSLSDFRGRPVLVNFWATWCPPCIGEMPLLQQVSADQQWTKAGLTVLAVNVGENQPTVLKFINKYKYTFTVLLDSNQAVSQRYRVRSFPTTLLIDKSGIIIAVKIGAFASKAEIENGLKRVLQ